MQRALDNGRPVVALESTIISHGMPYPQNVETALKVELIVRDSGAAPATIAILGGRLCVGLTEEQIDTLGKKGPAVHKASRRDIAVLAARGEDGATTVAATTAPCQENIRLMPASFSHGPSTPRRPTVRIR